MRDARWQMDLGGHHFLRVRVCQARLSGRLHEAVVLLALDQSEDTHAATLTCPDPLSVLPIRRDCTQNRENCLFLVPASEEIMLAKSEKINESMSSKSF